MLSNHCALDELISNFDCVKPAVQTKLLDVTLRDGGLANGFSFSEQHAKAHYEALTRVGVWGVELGYLGGTPDMHGAPREGVTSNLPISLIRYCSDIGGAHLVAMIHPTSQVSQSQIRSAADAGIEYFRVIYHPDWSAQFLEICRLLSNIGTRFFANIALVTHYSRSQLAGAVTEVRSAAPFGIYFADTCGSLDPSSISNLFLGCAVSASIELGFHGHDGLGLALANSIAATCAGASYVDCSLGGLGRGGGNLKLEAACSYFERLGANSLDLSELWRLSLADGRSVEEVAGWICAGRNLPPPAERAISSAIRSRDFSRLAAELRR